MPNYPQHIFWWTYHNVRINYIEYISISNAKLSTAYQSLWLFSTFTSGRHRFVFWAPSHAYISSFYLCSMYLNLFHWIEMLQTHSMSPWVRRVFIHLLPRLLIMKRPMKTMQMQRLILKLVIISSSIIIIINIIVINNNIIIDMVTFRLGPHSVLIMGKQCNGGPEVVMGWDKFKFLLSLFLF